MSAALIRIHRRLNWTEGVALNRADWQAVAHGAAPRVRVFEPAAPALSLGRRASSRPDAIVAATIELARSRGMQIVDDDRGGLATVHLPGQLVALVALPMERSQVSSFVATALAEIATLCVAVGVDSVDTIVDGPDAGLWSRGSKLASAGLRHAEGVLRHGFALNVRVAPDAAAGLTLCGRATHQLAQLQGTGASIDPMSIAPLLACALLRSTPQPTEKVVGASLSRGGRA
jgi:lipoate-protein ligase B